MNVKRIGLLVGCIAFVLFGLWYFRLPLLLQLVTLQSAREYRDLPAAPELAWQQGPAEANERASETRPNIVLIVADDLGFNDISTFGGGIANGAVPTPNIDRLAAEGAIFEQSYSGASTCAPSRAMMMTGRYPTRTGYEFTPTPPGMASIVSRLYNQIDPFPEAYYSQDLEDQQPDFHSKGLPTEEVTVAEVLKQQGYYTAHIGKWHLGRTNGMDPNSQGFDDSLLMQSFLFLPQDDPRVVNAKLDFDPIDRFLWAKSGFSGSFNTVNEQRFKPKGYLTDYWTDEAIRVIEANRSRPFFLYLAHWGVHTPLQATKEDYEAVGDLQPHRLRVYAAMIRALDRSVGRVLDALDQRGLSENTLVIFTSDNGGPGYIGLSDINKPFRGWKITQFEGGIRVPLFLRWPRVIESGVRINTPVAHIDMMPTISAAAQASLPSDRVVDGMSVLPLLTQTGRENWSRDTLFWQNGQYQVVRHGDWKLQVNSPKLTEPKQWLYHLAEDPYEINNLATRYPDKVRELSKLLLEHNQDRVPPLYPATTELPVLIDKTLAETYEEGDEYVYTPN
ncbi:Arylsulfatase [Aequoribacter fuscus]|uniref:Arylsulfatase n=1 Tax=Aequoribacter fuscus TaxID=2518989 RepID=F3L461_9GAMM|nr:sulfatase [Aequoribacter fuscus]EGG28891.1 Arylsulfatase [Aequoribacter fuscus]QHJ87403.1 sulfatase [Aequoribacter fuscus]